MQDVLREWQMQVILPGKQTITVRRNKVVHSIPYATSKQSFDFLVKPDIQFSGEDAIDGGGPTRELMRLMIKELPSMGVLEGPEDNLFFTHDVVALSAGKYKLAGQLVAWSLLHGGHRIAALNPLLFKLMCEQSISDDEYTISDISDVEVGKKIQKIKDCNTREDMAEVCYELTDWAADRGLYLSTDMKKKDTTVTALLKHHMYYSQNSMLTRDVFRALFYVNWAEQGSNDRQLQEDTVFAWDELLLEIEKSPADAKMTFSDILVFSTGTDRIPPLGFDSKIEIAFIKREKSEYRLPTTSTCAMRIVLPYPVDGPSQLKDMMALAVHGSHGYTYA